jgi:hypothetical protein
MNTFEFQKELQKITPNVVRMIGVEAMQQNETLVVFDAINANLEGLTFAGNKIDIAPFTDWDETGEFHQNLQFQDETDINFQSSGEGAEAVFSAFSYNDTIAPSVKIMSKAAINKVTQSFIQILKDKIK